MKQMNKVQQKKLLVIASSALLIILCVILFFFITQPSRSVENFCKVAKEEKGNFKRDASYDKLLSSFKKLDGVAPDTIDSDTSLIVKGYESILDDPSKAVASELGISNSQMRVNDYITKNCPNY